MRNYNVNYEGFFDEKHASSGTLLVSARSVSEAQEKAATILAKRFTDFQITNTWEA